MGACYGAGMIAGPALGGTLGGISPRAPFIVAALLNGFALLLVCMFLKETRRGYGETEKPFRLNPFVLFRLDDALRGLAALFVVFFIIQLIGQVPAALWVIYGEDRFQADSENSARYCVAWQWMQIDSFSWHLPRKDGRCSRFFFCLLPAESVCRPCRRCFQGP